MSAAIRRVVDPENNAPWEKMLYSDIPLVDLRVPRLLRSQIVSVVESPLRQGSILGALRSR